MCLIKRMFRFKFTFKDKQYNRGQKYYLVAYDDKNDIEVLRHEILIDIAFANDFGFDIWGVNYGKIVNP